MTAHLRQNKGFTLLELLVSLIIMGISLGAIFQVFSQSKRISWQSDEKMACTRLAQNIFANPALIGKAFQEKGVTGAVNGERGWQYKISVYPLTLASKDEETPLEIPSVLKLDLCLVHRTGGKEKTFELSRWYRQ